MLYLTPIAITERWVELIFFSVFSFAVDLKFELDVDPRRYEARRCIPDVVI